MIGGSDIVVDTRLAPSAALDLCVRAIRVCWPRAILQNGESGEVYAHYHTIPFAQAREMLIYEDDSAFESWKTSGATISNQNTLVHVVACTEGVTLVVDDPNAVGMAAMLEGIRRSILDVSRDLGPVREKAA